MLFFIFLFCFLFFLFTHKTCAVGEVILTNIDNILYVPWNITIGLNISNDLSHVKLLICSILIIVITGFVVVSYVNTDKDLHQQIYH